MTTTRSNNLTKSIVDLSEYETFLSDNEDTLILVDFGAAWCKPCKQIAPTVKKLAAAHKQSIRVIMIDIDDASEIAEKEQISCVPTFIFYKNGKQVKRFSGADEALLIKIIDLHK